MSLLQSYSFTMGYLPTFYAIIFVIALALAFSAGHLKSAMYLSLLYSISMVDAIWFDATAHMMANLGIFTLILFSCRNMDGMIIALITLIMTLSNGIFVIQGGAEFYRLSIINLLFLSQCLIVMRFSYNAHKNNGIKGNNGYFMAKVSSSEH